ncbi:MAG TPA: hypothetical protein VGS03_04575, partial [Candidatus Polarisedimenticolia bacterium]|nr:hypothetical protein [Candidatus Polarisedimenticolia bacterium]
MMEVVDEVARPARSKRRTAAPRVVAVPGAAAGVARPEPPPGPRTSLKERHLLGIQGLEADEITLVLDTARVMAE